MKNGCWNCTEYNGDSCMLEWNNADPVYYVPERDDKAPNHICEHWNHDKTVSEEEWKETVNDEM